MKKNKKLYIFSIIIICISSYLIVNKVLENDTFSAIKIGNYILDNGIDFKEHFNIQSNLSYHNARWLFNVIIALIYNHFGFLGIYIFTILTTITMGICIFNILLKINKKINLSLLVTLFIILISKIFLSARAQIISYLLFLLEIYFIEMLIKTNKKRYIIYIIISSILISNIHTTVWPMTLIVFIPYFIEYLFYKFKLTKKESRLYTEITSVKLLIISFVLTIFSGLVTPLGLTPYTYMFKTMSGFSKTFITELQVSNPFTIPSLFVLTIIYIYFLIYRKGKIKVSDLFLVIGLYIMGALAIRNLAFLFILCYISLYRIIYNSIDNEYIEKLTKYLSIKTIYILSCSMLLILSFEYHIIKVTNKDYIEEKSYPINATNYILKNVDIESMRIYNHFNFGSYLEFNGIKVFLDSRSEVYCEEFNNTRILKDWYISSHGNINYNLTFDKYDITHALLYNNEIINNYIKEDKNYKLLYKDDYFSFYERVKE